ncbi:hypothetical protein EJB05_54358, partial [Eragrostis curvula]
MLRPSLSRLWEGKRREVPCSTLYRRVGAHSTLVLQMTMEEKQLPPPPRKVGKFEVVMIDLGQSMCSSQGERSTGQCSGLSFVTPQVARQQLTHRLLLVWCTYQLVPVTSTQSEYRSFIDAHPTETWILMGDTKGWVSVWNYQTQVGYLFMTEERASLLSYDSDSVNVKTVRCLAGKNDGDEGHQSRYWRNMFSSFPSNLSLRTLQRTRSRNSKLTVAKLLTRWLFTRWAARSCSHRLPMTPRSNSGTGVRTGCAPKHSTCCPNRGVFRLKWNRGDTNTFSGVSFDKKIKIWNIDSTYPVTTLEESYNNDYLFLGSHERLMVTACNQEPLVEGFDSACIWDLQTEKRVHNLGMRGDTSVIACHPTLPLLATLLEYRIVCLWDARTYSTTQTFTTHAHSPL